MKAEKKLAMNLAFGLLSVMAMACEKPSVSECGTSYFMSMDYTLTFKEIIKTHDYESLDSNFENKEFSLQGSVITQSVAEIEVVLVHLNTKTKVVNTEKIIKDMDKLGLRPAQAEELIVFIENYLHTERWRFPVVALGSYWVNEHDGRSVACLDVDDHYTNLYLVEFNNYWSERYHFHFLAVRK